MSCLLLSKFTRLGSCVFTLLVGVGLAALLLAALTPIQPVLAASAGRLQADLIPVTTTIQAAIDAASPGDTVFVPAGNYTESLTLNKAVSLTGFSSATVVIHAISNERVLTATGTAVDSRVVISGLTFAGGHPVGLGGGILLEAGATPRLLNLVIRDNHDNGAGGGLYATDPVSLTNVGFIDNATQGEGGGADLVSGGILTNVLFRGNLCILFLGDCTGGGLSAEGAVSLVNVTFLSNTSQGYAGGAYLVTSTITGGLFQGNQCTGINCAGAGMAAVVSLTLSGTQFVDNIGLGNGSGLWFINGSGQIVNAIFARNQTRATGSAIYLQGSGESVSLVHTTIASPNTSADTALRVDGNQVTVTNTIIASYTTGIERVSGIVSEDYNVLFHIATHFIGAVNSGGHGNTRDPVFANPAADDYHLRFGSSAIDAGLDLGVPIDYEGDPRPFGIGVDIGADEALIVVQRSFLPLVLKP